MPSPFNRMLLQSANSFESTIANDQYRQIRDEFQKSIVLACQSLAANRYPLDRNARNEIGLADFGRLFEPMVISTGSSGNWSLMRTHRNASGSGVRTIRLRNRCRRRPCASSSAPPRSKTRSFRQRQRPDDQPDRDSADACRRSCETGNQRHRGCFVQSAQPRTGRSAMAGCRWQDRGVARPRSCSSGSSAFRNTRHGQWALFRLLDRAGKSPRPNGIAATWIVGGRDVPFQLGTGTVYNRCNCLH